MEYQALNGDTKVFTTEGLVALNNIKKGDEILTTKGTSKVIDIKTIYPTLKFEHGHVMTDKEISFHGLSENAFYRQIDIIAEEETGNFSKVFTAKFYQGKSASIIRCFAQVSLSYHYDKAIGKGDSHDNYNRTSQEALALGSALKKMGHNIDVASIKNMDAWTDILRESFNHADGIRKVVYVNTAFA